MSHNPNNPDDPYGFRKAAKAGLNKSANNPDDPYGFRKATREHKPVPMKIVKGSEPGTWIRVPKDENVTEIIKDEATGKILIIPRRKTRS
jgi:hypothetical protein